MKMAQGYVTDDGTFFESKNDAALHEAEMRLRSGLAGVYGGMNQEVFFEVVLGLMPELWSYIDAYNSAATVKLDQPTEDTDGAKANVSESPKADASMGHVSSTEEDLASLLKLPTRGPSHVPNVGGGPHAEKVSKRRQKHGA